MNDEKLKSWSNCIFAYDNLKCHFCGVANCEKCKYRITKNAVVDYLCNVSNDNLLTLRVINDLVKKSNQVQ